MSAMDEVSDRQVLLDMLPDPTPDCRFFKEDFLDDDFSVDKFVRIHRSDVPLEKLREVLSTYLKRVRLALNDLINRDYADFVNLSTNLVGMDKSISILASSLNISKQEVVATRNEFHDAVSLLRVKMTSLQETRQLRTQMEKIIEAITSLDKLEQSVNVLSSENGPFFKNGKTPKHAVDIQQVFVEMRHVRRLFNSLSITTPLVMNLQLKASSIYVSVVKHCENMFLEAIKEEDRDTAKQILNLYEQTNECQRLEHLVRTSVVKPQLNIIISESFIRENGLDTVYKTLLNYVDVDCRFLERLTSANCNFIKNSVWAELIDRIRTAAVAGDQRS